MSYIGIDLGTSACKLLLVEENGTVQKTVTKEYPLSFPHSGWSEQAPELWWQACREGVPALLEGFDPAQVQGIGIGGQMHGLVALDATGRVLRRAALNREQAVAAMLDMAAKFPGIGMEVMAGDGDMYVVQANPYTHAHQVDEGMSGVACPIDSVPDGWAKVVFAGDPEMIRKAGQYAKTRYYGRDNYFLATNSIYLEIMPTGVGKASALQDLCALLGEPIENTIVIGDYYNDLEMMQQAGYSVAVANAPPEVKAAANEVTICTCAEGAVGEYLYKLIEETT